MDDEDDESGDYAWSDDQFTSSFWIERKWIFHAEIDTDAIVYLICPYKKTWYDSAEIDTNSMVSVQQKTGCTSSILTIKDPFFSECPELLFKNIFWVTSVTSIYHLQFSKQRIPIRKLIKIINCLPNLDSLKIWSLLLIKPKRSSWKEKQFISDVTNNNTITKVYLENMIKFEEISSLIDLFPRMKYLLVGWTNNIDIELFVRIILMKIIKKSNNDLRSLCFCIQMADDEMVKKLQNIIDYKKLLFDYRIKRISDKIYLQWG